MKPMIGYRAPNCQKCGYSLRGVHHADTCPECGYSIEESSRRFVRKRLAKGRWRDWRPTFGLPLLALVLVISIVMQILLAANNLFPEVAIGLGTTINLIVCVVAIFMTIRSFRKSDPFAGVAGILIAFLAFIEPALFTLGVGLSLFLAW